MMTVSVDKAIAAYQDQRPAVVSHGMNSAKANSIIAVAANPQRLSDRNCSRDWF